MMDVLSAKSASSPMLRDDHKSRDYSPYLPSAGAGAQLYKPEG